MPNPWRQGDLLNPDDAVALGLIDSSQRDSHRVLVISHSCDIARDVEAEPAVEVLIGALIDEEGATSQSGHSIGRLHLGSEPDSSQEWTEYHIAARRIIKKTALLQNEPCSARRYAPEQRRVLQRWLAQRYARSEFPDAFINWLQQSGVDRRFEELGKSFSSSLVGIYFDLDDDSERTDVSAPYALGVQLVYDAGDAAHALRAETAAQKLTDIFRRRCLKGSRWQWIELLYCEAVSDEVFSLRAARSFRRWRFEHRSIHGEPFDPDE
jgi:hypothetical protein